MITCCLPISIWEELLIYLSMLRGLNTESSFILLSLRTSLIHLLLMSAWFWLILFEITEKFSFIISSDRLRQIWGTIFFLVLILLLYSARNLAISWSLSYRHIFSMWVMILFLLIEVLFVCFVFLVLRDKFINKDGEEWCEWNFISLTKISIDVP